MIATREQHARVGVIEALTSGFELVFRTPWVVGLPVLLDAFLWRGPQVSIAPLVERALTAYQRLPSTLALGEIGTPPPETIDLMRETLTGVNLLSALALNFVAVPSSVQTRPSGGPVVATLEQPLSFVAMFVGLEMVGLALGCLFFAAIAQRARHGELRPATLLASVPRFWLRFALIALALIALPFAVGLPVMLLLGLTALLSPLAAQALGTMLLVAAQVAFVWLAIYMFFVVPAVVLSDLGARSAVATSVRVVSRNFWGALGLIVLSFVITQGMFQIWSMLGQSDLGSLVAMVGHAYVASGLAAASMVFYWNRVQHEQKV